MRRLSSCLFTFLFLATLSPAKAADAALPKLGADPAQISISGLSSGAFMAVQYGVAYSGGTKGVGVVAGGPYGCAELNGVNFIAVCMNGQPVPPSGQASLDLAEATADTNDIDAVANIASQKIYLFSGTKDNVVRPQIMDAVKDFYLAAQVSPDNFTYKQDLGAGHAFLSYFPNVGNACDLTQSPFIVHCKTSDGFYDQPEAILSRIYGPLQPRAKTLSSAPIAFNQTEFSASSHSWFGFMWSDSLAKTGYVYIPASCRELADKKCAVHVVFHGCLQGAEKVGDDVYSKLGYNEWADTNKIIVLYPQITVSNFLPANPQGCWDWWGYTGLDFYTRKGAQLSAIHAMIERLLQQ